jgi:hypothetical protein
MKSFGGNDKLKIGFPKDLVLYNKEGRSVVLDYGDPSGNSTIDVFVPIQPQLAENVIIKWINLVICCIVPLTTSLMYI